MLAYIYIHSSEKIVESYKINFENLKEIDCYLIKARKEYGDRDNFCFDVMIL